MGDHDRKLSWGFGKKRVLCVGSTYIEYVSTVKNFPEENYYEQAIAGYWQRGGNASINCTVLRNLGVNVEFFGMLSSLPIFQVLVDDMKARGIIVENCPTCEQSAPFASVILTKSLKTRNLISCNNDFPYATIEDFRKLNLRIYGWIHLRGLPCETMLAIVKEIAEFNATSTEKIITSVEIDQVLDEMFPLVDYCDYAFFSKQLATDNGWTSPADACKVLDERLAMRWGLNLSRPVIIVLLGDKGAGVMDLHGNYTHAAPYKPKRIVDALGAGNTFVSAFIYAIYIRERSLKIAVDFGSRIASYKCTKNGYDHVANILLPPVL